MKDYNSVEIDFTNKIALSMQPGMENDVTFLDTYNASSRFLHLAKIASDKGFLGWQISADKQVGEISSFVFTSTGVNATAKDYNWIFKNCAVSRPDGVPCLKNLYEENRKVYALSYKSEPTKYFELFEDDLFERYNEDEYRELSPNRHFREMIEMFEEAGAVIRMIADSPEEKEDSDLVFISFPDDISLRLRGMISMALPNVEIEDISNLPDGVKASKHIPEGQFRSIMSNLLYALISRQTKEAETSGNCRQEETTVASEEDGGGSSDSIEKLDLSIRTCNCLQRAGIWTIEALKTMTDEDYQHIRNLGLKSKAEIKEKLAEYLQGRSDFEKIPSLQAASYYDMLDELIGLKEAKQQIRKIAAFAKMKQDMDKCEGASASVVLNMEFVGNPGTAKTTVARIVAGIFHEIGILSSEKMIEVGRADLIAEYQGQTARKVQEVFRKAKGKLLFIDEAYSLLDDWKRGYGDEAISTIVQEMENNREDTIVVFAGYPDEMKEFFSRNPGLRSRVPFIIRFHDYAANEMFQIAELEAKKRGFSFAPEASERILSICKKAAGKTEAGNGRFCRNLVENAVLEYAARVYGTEEYVNVSDYVLTSDDFPEKCVENMERSVKNIIGFKALEEEDEKNGFNQNRIPCERRSKMN